ncbi:cytochrome mitochondrial precursor [Moniliophthora roreri MCA 2997]|uniref:Cytochrome mitochondrial n=1 Tax=Moniliophthora roreri (strain MCA 2997) TaxID=1381753 RepID=V2WUI4_MONRO|nr:cytochrome mitochondrial precursor [Moniliophthora roreri MCA 2997]KAI3618221.1 cytochrome mitochondrial precursor [Moniliophthora roreri]
MRVSLPLVSFLLASTYATRPFLNEPDTGIEGVLGALSGNLPNLTSVVGLPDFDWVARQVMPLPNYTYYRNGVAGEWSYRNNLEVYYRFRLRPRVLVDVTEVEKSLPTEILGYNFSAPFFISPCARAGYAHPDAELNLMRGAAQENILYMVSDYATLSKDTIREAIPSNQTLFQQIYISNNRTTAQAQIQAAEASGFKAIMLTVDAPAEASRHRAARFGVGSANAQYTYFSWEYYNEMRNWTSLPIIPKGILTWEDAVKAVEVGAPAIFLSNHGGRQLDSVPSPLEVALEIHENAPWVFNSTTVLADGGVRYGTDALKLLALGVKAVGVGRPFMYSNVFGVDGVVHAAKILKNELAANAGNLGIADLKKITPDYVSWRQNYWYS